MNNATSASNLKSPRHGFVAYPSGVREVGIALGGLPAAMAKRSSSTVLHSWEANDIAGHCLIDPIKEQIESGDFLIADITVPNFNVFFEIGYAIGKQKRVLLLVNAAIRRDSALLREIGLFETLGYKQYSNVADACKIVEQLPNVRPLALPDGPKNRNSPIFVCLPKDRTDSEVRIISRIKKTSAHIVSSV